MRKVQQDIDEFLVSPPPPLNTNSKDAEDDYLMESASEAEADHVQTKSKSESSSSSSKSSSKNSQLEEQLRREKESLFT